MQCQSSTSIFLNSVLLFRSLFISFSVKLIPTLHPNYFYCNEFNGLPFVRNRNNRIITNIYHKPTGTEQNIHFKNQIPVYNTSPIVKSAFAQKDYTKNSKTWIIHTTSKQGFRSNFSPTSKRNNEQIPAYVQTYENNNSELFKEITRCLHLLQKNDKLKDILKTPKLIKRTSQSKK